MCVVVLSGERCRQDLELLEARLTHPSTWGCKTSWQVLMTEERSGGVGGIFAVFGEDLAEIRRY